jgi:diguanylate cyclase (GGDEF)-like protein/PAS domain S-box-containing protein
MKKKPDKLSNLERADLIAQTLADVPSQSVLININHMVKKVEDTFENNHDLLGVIIIKKDVGELLGMISRKRFTEIFSKPFRKELYSNKPLKSFVQYDFDSPLCLDETETIDQAVRKALSRSNALIYEPIVVRGGAAGLRIIDINLLLMELVKEYEHQSNELRKSEEKYRIIFRDSPDSYSITKDGIFADCNHELEVMLRCDRTQIVGKTPEQFSPEFQPDGRRSSEAAREKIEDALRIGNNTFEWLHCRLDGSLFYAEIAMASMVLDGDAVLFVSWRDITERKTAEKMLEETNRKLELLSKTDGLTGIANRRHFDEVLSQEYNRHCRSGAELSFILLDIDYFKSFNDIYGHVKGDECLQLVARVMADCAKRPDDLTARYGGEEFACILPETNFNGAATIADNIRRGILALAIPHKGSKVAEYLTASLGVVSTRCSIDKSPLNIIKHADELLYQAKSQGRNRVEFNASPSEDKNF